MSGNDKKNQSIDEVVRQVTDAVKPYVDKAMPYLEMAKEKAEPTLKTVMDKAEPTLKTVMDKAEPTLRKAKEKAEPKIREARKKAEPVIDEVKTRASKASVKTEVFLQFGDYEMRIDDIIDKAREDYLSRGGTLRSLKSLRVYVKPEDHAAYYVANHDETGRVSL